jgi:hypothetical protein
MTLTFAGYPLSEVEEVHPSTLRPWARQVRLPSWRGTRPWARLQETARSTERIWDPLIVLPDGQIVDGHARWQTAMALGLNRVLVRRLQVPMPLPEQVRLELEYETVARHLGRRHLNLEEISGLELLILDMRLRARMAETDDGAPPASGGGADAVEDAPEEPADEAAEGAQEELEAASADDEGTQPVRVASRSERRNAARRPAGPPRAAAGLAPAPIPHRAKADPNQLPAVHRHLEDLVEGWYWSVDELLQWTKRQPRAVLNQVVAELARADHAIRDTITAVEQLFAAARSQGGTS